MTQPSNTDWILHICQAQDWEAALGAGNYRASSLDQEGFIHLSRPDQVLAVANRFYRNAAGLVLLWVDASRLTGELKWEPPGEPLSLRGKDEAFLIFPHVYGPINLDAVRRVTKFLPDEDGVFRRLE